MAARIKIILTAAQIASAVLCARAQDGRASDEAAGGEARHSAPSVSESENEKIDENGVSRVLEEFPVTAYRFGSAPLDTPVNSTYIDYDAIASSPYTNVADVIKNYGNVNFRSVTGSSASGDFSMRGFGENSQTRLLVLVDGQKINRADMGAINWLQIPLSDVEGIEILRGSQSALYGSSAESGVIKITTLRAKEDGYSAVAQGIYGSYNTYNAAVHITGREGDYFFAADVGIFSSDGWRDNSASDSKNAALSLGYDINKNNTLVLSGSYAESLINYPGPLTYQQYQQDPTQSTSAGAYSKSKDGLFTANLTTSSSVGEGEVGVGASTRDIFWTLGGRSKNFQWTGTLTPRYKFEVGDDAHLLVGFDGSCDSVDFKKYYQDTPYTKSFADADRFSLAPYLGGDWNATQDLSFTAVGRFDAERTHVANTEYIDSSISPTRTIVVGGHTYVVPNPNYPAQINTSDTYDSSMWQRGWSANFGSNYKFTKSASIFFKFDQIYHYPVLDEVAAYQGAVLPVMFNFNLKPEKGQNYEIGAKYISGEWTFVGSLFLMNLTDEISYFQDSNGDWLNTNLPPTMRMGADIEARYDSEYWGAGAMLAAVRAKFDGGIYDGNDIPLVPSVYGNISAYVRPIKMAVFITRLSFVSEQYVGSDYSNLSDKIPAYALLDFQINFNFCKYCTAFLALENALDKRYVSCAWASGYYPGMGRMMKAGVSIRF